MNTPPVIAHLESVLAIIDSRLNEVVFGSEIHSELVKARATTIALMSHKEA